MKSSKYIPKIPSEPARIPTKIKMTSEGTPNLPPILLKIIAEIKSIEAIKRFRLKSLS